MSVLEAKTKCLSCEKKFLNFYSLQKHKKSEDGKLSRIQHLTVDLQPIMCDCHDQQIGGNLTACQHILVDSEFVRGRQHILNFA